MTEASNPMLRYKERQSTRTIIVHDSHTPPEIGQAEEVSNWFPEAEDTALHMGLLSLGYHYIIERDGTVKPGREVSKIGSHTPGFNMDSIGVCLVGGRNHEGEGEDNFPHSQRKALIRLYHKLMDRYGKLRIVGHSEIQKYRNKSLPPCPMLDMEMLREDIDLYSKGIAI